MLVLLLTSCYKDKTTDVSAEYGQVTIENIQEKYKVVAFADEINLKPEIKNAEGKELSYLWGKFMLVTADPDEYKLDTLGMEKNLDLKINFKPGTYKLVLIVKDLKTEIETINSSELVVESMSSRGWYVLKSQNGKSDLDIFNEHGKGENVYSENAGEKLDGEAVQIGFNDRANWFDPEKNELNRMIRVVYLLTDKDIARMRMSDAKVLDKFKDIFYGPYADPKPQAWTINGYGDFLVTNNKAHGVFIYGNSGKFGYEYRTEYDYSLAPHILPPNNPQNNPIVYDNLKGTFYGLHYFSTSYLTPFTDEGNDTTKTYYPHKNLNADNLFMDYKFGGYKDDGDGIALLKTRDAVKRLVIARLELYAAGYFGQNKNPVYALDTIPQGMEIENAKHYAVNKRLNLLYYSNANKLSAFNLSSQAEEVIHNFTTGEEITHIHHRVHDEPDAEEYSFDKLVVATYDGTNYKVYLFDMLAGKPKPNPIIYEGEGKVGHVYYISPALHRHKMHY